MVSNLHFLFTKKIAFFILAIAIAVQTINAGPTLESCDLMVVGYNTDLDDQFAFVALADIPGSSVIFITDEGWDDSDFTFDGGEDVYKWTVASGGISAGAIIRFSNEATTTLTLKNSSYGTLSHVNGTSDMSLAAGDQLFIYQTSDDTYTGTIQRLDSGGSAEAGMIYAFNADNSEPQTYGWLDAGNAHTSTASQAPDYMTVVTTTGGDGNAFGLLTQFDLKSVTAAEYDNYRYDGATTSATKEDWITRIHTTANWLADDPDTLGIFSGAIASDFTVTLPVELTEFGADLSEDAVDLNWVTATEVNNYGFDIERKYVAGQDTSEWVKIGFVEGNGTSNSEHSYSYTDNSLPTADEVSYRLKQIDVDGAYEYSKVVTVNISGITGIGDTDLPVEFELSQNYPNPFNPTTRINYQIASQSNVTLKVYDMLGREVMTLVDAAKTPGSYEVQFDGTRLTSGVYFYKLQAGDFVSVKKMMMMK